MSDSLLVDVVRVRQMCLSGEARRTRVEAGVSIDELATAVGVDKSTVSRWETGESRPRFASAVRYGEALRHIADLRSDEPPLAKRMRCLPDDPVIDWMRSLSPLEIRRIYRRAGKTRHWVAKHVPASEMTIAAWEQGRVSNGAAYKRFGELLMELEDDWSVAYYRRCLDAVAEFAA